MSMIETTTITLDRDRKFILSFGTIRRFEKKSGKTLSWLINELGLLGTENASSESEVFEALGILMWAGVVTNDPELTVEQVFEMLPVYPVDQVRQVFEAISNVNTKASQNGANETPLVSGSMHGPSVESS